MMIQIDITQQQAMIIDQHTNTLLSFRRTYPTRSFIKNQQQQKKEKEKGKECYYLLYFSHRSTIQHISNCRTIQHITLYVHTRQKGNMSSINKVY